MNRILFMCIAFFSYCAAEAQSMAINSDGSTADASALLDVKSTAKGVLVPRMTKAEKNTIPAPANGLLVYQTGPDSTGFHYYDGTAWKWLAAAANTPQGWLTTGNVGTTTSNFLGTIDDVPLSFRQNNNWTGRLDAATRNYYIGGGAGALAGGNTNVAMGDSALRSGTASQAVVIGGQAGKNNNSTGSIVIGYEAAAANTTPGVAIGYQSQRLPGSATNTSVGSFTMIAGATGSFNTALGYTAMQQNGGGIGNTGIGSGTLNFNIASHFNTAVGYNAMNRFLRGASNDAFGAGALSGVDTSLNSTALGGSALTGSFGTVDTSVNNVAIGYLSQNGVRNSRGNVSVGAQTMVNNSYGSYNTALGDSALRFSGSGNRNVMVGKSAGLTAFNSNENVYVGAFSGNQTPFFGFSTSNNTFIGHRSGISTIDGAAKNTFVGDSSGLAVTSGTHNTFIGANAGSGVGFGNLTNATAIGYRAYATESNTLILGGINGVNGATADTRVGIGTTTPSTGSLFSVTNNFMVQPSGSLQYSNSVGNMAVMFESGTGNADRMVIAHSPGFLNYGLQYQDASDKFNFLSAGLPVQTVDLTNLRVGVNTSSPNSTLHVDGSFAVGTSMGVTGGGLATPAALDGLKGYIGLSPSGGNDYYELPDPATCPGRIYYIRNNNNPGADYAFIRSAGAGQICSGGGACLGAGTYYTITTGNPNPVPKTVICISDGTNWTVGRID
jgi:trimeric autotransporter adhesin